MTGEIMGLIISRVPTAKQVSNGEDNSDCLQLSVFT